MDLRTALDVGYRYVDTATHKGNEGYIGEVIEEYINAGKLKRSDLFIATQLPVQFHQPEAVKRSIEDSLKRLRLDYIDLFSLSPNAVKPDSQGSWALDANGKAIPDLTPHIDTWRVLEDYCDDGKLKSIGVAHFSAQQLQDLYDKAEIKPHNLQARKKDLYSLARRL